MSKESEKKTKTVTVTVHRMSGRNKFLLITISLLLMAFLRTGFLIFLIGMLPSIVVYFFDRSEHHYTFRTIFSCNLAGCLPFLGHMFEYGPTNASLHEATSSTLTWVLMYGSAIMGGALIAFTPQIAKTMITGLHQTQIARLQRSQARIEAEWGKEVTNYSAKFN